MSWLIRCELSRSALVSLSELALSQIPAIRQVHGRRHKRCLQLQVRLRLVERQPGESSERAVRTQFPPRAPSSPLFYAPFKTVLCRTRGPTCISKNVSKLVASRNCVQKTMFPMRRLSPSFVFAANRPFVLPRRTILLANITRRVQASACKDCARGSVTLRRPKPTSFNRRGTRRRFSAHARTSSCDEGGLVFRLQST